MISVRCFRCFLLASLVLMGLGPVPVLAAECVMVLHGLGRSDWAMSKLAENLAENDFWVVNIDYPSRDYSIPELAEMTLSAGISECGEVSAPPYHVVSHSLGGILLRFYREQDGFPELGRAVMLAPPNQGSQVADRLEGLPGFEWLMGPAAVRLGTGEEDIPSQLGPVDFELGVIAGTRSLDPVSSLMLPDPDDGKVSVSHTRVEGMCSMLVLPVTHALMMRNDRVIEEVSHFLKAGRFAHADAENGLCPAFSSVQDQQ